MARSAHPDGEKHHYLPVFYLQQWTGKDGQLCQFSRPYNDVRPKRVYPKGTGYKRGLNTFPSLDPEAADFLEHRFFLQADDLAARALEFFLGNEREITTETRDAWSRFLMTLFHRTPEGIDRIKMQVFKDIEGVVDMEPLRSRYHELRKEGDPPTFEEFKVKYMIKVKEHATVASLQTVMDSERVGTVLNGMEWRVLLAGNASREFLTSDRPIIMSNGLGRPDAYLMLPISPRRLFIAVRDSQVIKHIERIITPDELVDFVNDRVARQARTFVYGATDVLLDFVKPRLGEKAWWAPLRD